MATLRKPTVVYITSHGHSGSTLLDSLIGSHSQVTSVGEAKWLSPSRKFDGRCTCNASSIWQCPFWRQVSASIATELSISLREIDLLHPDEHRFQAHNAAFYRQQRWLAAFLGH